MNFKLTIRLDNGVLDTPADVAVNLQKLALQLLRLPHALDCWPESPGGPILWPLQGQSGAVIGSWELTEE